MLHLSVFVCAARATPCQTRPCSTLPLRSICFATPCREVASATFDGHIVGDKHEIHFVAFNCPSVASNQSGATREPGSHRRLSASAAAPSNAALATRPYNEFATLLMQTQEGAIKQLFSRGTAGAFGARCLSSAHRR